MRVFRWILPLAAFAALLPTDALAYVGPGSPVMKSEFTQFSCGATMITSIAVSPCISAMMAMARSTSD